MDDQSVGYAAEKVAWNFSRSETWSNNQDEPGAYRQGVLYNVSPKVSKGGGIQFQRRFVVGDANEESVMAPARAKSSPKPSRKGSQQAKKSMVAVPRKETTIPAPPDRHY